MSIYVVTHKKYPIPKMKEYVPIQVGAALHDDLGYLRDSDGEDQISAKNKNYCELTALYYIWKNRSDPIVGMVHYRRYFYSKRTIHPDKEIMPFDEAKRLLKTYDLILPYKMYRQGKTIKEDYAIYHNLQDYEKCREIVSRLYPDYLSDFDAVSKQKTLYQYNMFICRRELLDDYCRWLFDILFELEHHVDISDYDDYNQRIFGFLSERLFNVWIAHHKFKIKKSEVYNIEDGSFKLMLTNIKNVVKPLFGVDR